MAQLVNIIQDEATYKASNTTIVTCIFAPQSEKNSTLATMLAKGAFGSANSYTLSFDLSRIFPEMVGENGKFQRMKAYKEFLGIMPIGINVPEINCFDIPVSEISDFDGVQFEKDGETRTIRTYHLAIMGNREQAVQLAKSGLVNGINKGRLTPLEDGANVAQSEKQTIIDERDDEVDEDDE